MAVVMKYKNLQIIKSSFFTAFAVIFVFAACTSVLQAEAVDISPNEINLIPHAKIIQSDLENPEIKDLLALPYVRAEDGQRIFSFGFSDHVHYFLIEIINPQKKPVSRLLVFSPSWIDSVQAVRIDAWNGRQMFTGGDSLPFNERYIPHQYVNFKIDFNPGTNFLLVKTKTDDPHLVGMMLFEENTFFRNDVYDKMYVGIVYGILFVMLLYNLALFISLREFMFIAYVNYILYFILMHSTYNGHLYHLFWPENPEWSNWAHSVFIYFYAFSGLIFLISFLDLRKKYPVYYEVTLVFILLVASSFLITAVAGGYRLHVRSSIVLAFIYPVFVLTIAFLTILSENRSGSFFFFAALAGFAGSFVTAMTVMGFAPFTFINYHAVDLGMMLDAVLLSLAMADRLRIARGDAYQAKAELLDVSRKHAENLEKEVERKTSDLQNLNRQLLNLTLSDPLTGIGNRRKMDEFLVKEWARHLRNQKPLTFIICDVDFFKKYNDSLGHLAGDEALKKIAAAIQGVVTRPTDLIARYGGEEFAIALPETKKRGAYVVAEKIRSAVASLELHHPGYDGGGIITLSAGFVSMVPQTSFELEDLIRMADEALYRAKSEGRNRVAGAAVIIKEDSERS